jgi:hypothetical protein
MGFFDLFKGKKGKEGGGSGDASADAKAAAKWAEKAADKRAQNYDRQEALSALAEMGTPEAAAALLKRFNFTMDPSITDADEKQVAFEGVLKAGRGAITPVRAYAAKAESLAWPMKILKELLDEEAFVDELCAWLARWDTEYAKFIDPKLQLLVALEDHKAPKILEVVTPFLEDVNEPARFHAVATTLAQGDASAVPALVQTLIDEESLRVKNKILDGISARGWTIPEDVRDAARKALPSVYGVDGDGRITKQSD